MLTSSTKKRLGMALVGIALVGAGALTSPAKADPKQLTALVGVGSDTVQDVANALAGTTNGLYYDPVHSSVASGSRQLISFDAFSPTNVSDLCITTKTGGPTFIRPNGSGAGQKALSRAQDFTGWGTTAACGGIHDVSGQIDFARSSSKPDSANPGSALTFIPFGRDAVSFAYYSKTGTPVTTLTPAQLTTLFTTGPQTIGGIRIVPCGIQSGSGTYKFWLGLTGNNSGQEITATAECNGLVNPTGTLGGRLEENDGTALKLRGDTGNAGDEYIVGFSAGSFIAKTNLVAPGAPPAGVGIGSIDFGGTTGVQSPIAGTGTSLTPNATFYGDANFGRKVYTVWPTGNIDPAVIGNNDIKTLVVGSTSAVCSATTTIQKFGFLSLGTSCGTITETQALAVGQS
jgi:ABC-type phosphate transport system substrate-binding protein